MVERKSKVGEMEGEKGGKQKHNRPFRQRYAFCAPLSRGQAGLRERVIEDMRWELFGHCCWFTGRETIVSIPIPHAPRKLKYRLTDVRLRRAAG
jgi:hypothetical protein